jgi:hypothetical protein
MSLSFLRLPARKSGGPRPGLTWETTLSGPLGQGALCGQAENTKEFLVMGLPSRGRDEFRPRIVDHVEDPGKLSWRGSIWLRRAAMHITARTKLYAAMAISSSFSSMSLLLALI